MARAWHLMRRPQGMPVPEDFALKEFALPELGDGMVRVRNRWLSVDPYMRGRMNDVKSYVPPFALDAPMEGGAVGEVVESRDPGFAPGDMVLHMSGWRDEAVAPGVGTQQAARHSRRRAAGLPRQSRPDRRHRLFRPARGGVSAKEGDIVFVSAAAGAVGSAVVQIAKAKGMTVIGSAGGAGQMRIRPVARRRCGGRLQGRDRC